MISETIAKIQISRLSDRYPMVKPAKTDAALKRVRASDDCEGLRPSEDAKVTCQFSAVSLS